MKPIYFPFTRISEPDAVAVTRRLGPISVCCEIDRDSFCDTVDSHGVSGVERICPIVEGADRIEALAQQFLKWGNLHQNDMAVLNKFGDAAFYNNEFVANISSQIQKSNGRETDVDDPVFMARLFLNFARRLDTREEEVFQEVRAADDAGRSLVAELTGSPAENGFGDNFLGNASPPGDIGRIATETRLTAYFRMVCQLADPPRLYVTTSRAVMEYLADRFDGMTFLARTDGVPEHETRPEPFSETRPKWIDTLLDPALACEHAVDLKKNLPDFKKCVSPDGYYMEIYAIAACNPAFFVHELAKMTCPKEKDAELLGLMLVFLIGQY